MNSFRPRHLPKTGEWDNEQTRRVASEMMDWAIDGLAAQGAPVNTVDVFADSVQRYVEGWIDEVGQEAERAYGMAGVIVVGWSKAYVEGVDWNQIAAEYLEEYIEERDRNGEG